MVERGLRRAAVTATVILAALLELIDTTIVNVSLPSIQGELGATLSEAVWVIAAYAVANAIAVPAAGWLASLFGRRRHYIGSILLFTAASLLCARSDSIWELTLWRFVQGLGGGGLLTNSQTILVESYPPEQLSLATAIYGNGALVGPTFGPTLGGYLTDHYSWSWCFYINLPLGLIAAAMAFLFVREPAERRSAKELDWRGLLLLIGGVGGLQIVLERGHDEGWLESPSITALAAISAACLAAFIWWELRAEHPVVNLRVLKNRSTAVGTALAFMQGTALYGSLLLYPVFVQRLLGFSSYQTGLTLVAGGLATIVGMRIAAFLMRRGVPPNLMAGAGFALIALFCYEMSLKTLEDGEGVLFDRSFFWPLVMRGAGLALVFVPLVTIALSGLRGPDIAQGSGLTNMARQLGGSLVGALTATFVGNRVAAHRLDLIQHISLYDEATRQRLEAMAQGFMARGASAAEAREQAIAGLERVLMPQALHLSFIDAFRYAALAFLGCALLVFFVGNVRRSGRT